MLNLEQLSLIKIDSHNKAVSSSAAYFSDLSQTLNEIIEKEINNHEFNSNTYKSTLDPLTITQCSRRLAYKYFDIQQKMPNPPYIASMSQSTNMKKWLDFLDKCCKISVLQRNVMVADSANNLTGYIDGVIELEDDNSVNVFAIKIYELLPDDFETLFSDKGNLVPRKDVVDLNICMWMAELKKSILLYSDSFSGRFRVFEVGLKQSIIKKVEEKCQMLNHCFTTGTLPARPYSTISGECNICEFKRECWKLNNADNNQ